jgi:L-amino acid N-acyltransferase YncA
MSEPVPKNFPVGVGRCARQATIDDVPRITEIWLEGVNAAFGTVDAEVGDLSQIHARLSKLVQQQTENFKFWVCLEGSTIVGWSTVQPFHTTPMESMRNAYGFLSTYISKDCQGRGVGLDLVTFVIDYCRSHTQISFVLGLQDRSNVPSVAVTDRLGFTNFGSLPQVPDVPTLSIIACNTHSDVMPNTGF